MVATRPALWICAHKVPQGNNTDPAETTVRASKKNTVLPKIFDNSFIRKIPIGRKIQIKHSNRYSDTSILRSALTS